MLGNPPFIGARVMTKEQKATLLEVATMKGNGNLDFVAGWYLKAAQLMEQMPKLQAALVSTNSVVQGMQATILFKEIFDKAVKINFAHQTFKWDNNGAAVFVIIIGFAKFDRPVKKLFTYEKITDEPVSTDVKNINQYLLPAPTVFVDGRKPHISGLPTMEFGNRPIDDGNFILSDEERSALTEKYPELSVLIHPFIGARELLHNEKRFVLFLKDAPLKLLQNPEIRQRVQAVKDFRLASKNPGTVKIANTPTLFYDDRYTATPVLAIPSATSGNREYVPIGYYDENTIISNLCFQLSNATLGMFALLQSKLHMAWLDTVGGRLKGDYRYSNTLVYNTFVVPETAKGVPLLEHTAQAILDARQKYLDQGASLAGMYDPLTMPPDLRKAHQDNDKLVDSLYGLKNPTKEERVARLMELYLESVKEK